MSGRLVRRSLARRRIDERVYWLYGLTEDEILIVEQSGGKHVMFRICSGNLNYHNKI